MTARLLVAHTDLAAILLPCPSPCSILFIDAAKESMGPTRPLQAQYEASATFHWYLWYPEEAVRRESRTGRVFLDWAAAREARVTVKPMDQEQDKHE